MSVNMSATKVTAHLKKWLRGDETENGARWTGGATVDLSWFDDNVFRGQNPVVQIGGERLRLLALKRLSRRTMPTKKREGVPFHLWDRRAFVEREGRRWISKSFIYRDAETRDDLRHGVSRPLGIRGEKLYEGVKRFHRYPGKSDVEVNTRAKRRNVVKTEPVDPVNAMPPPDEVVTVMERRKGMPDDLRGWSLLSLAPVTFRKASRSTPDVLLAQGEPRVDKFKSPVDSSIATYSWLGSSEPQYRVLRLLMKNGRWRGIAEVEKWEIDYFFKSLWEHTVENTKRARHRGTCCSACVAPNCGVCASCRRSDPCQHRQACFADARENGLGYAMFHPGAGAVEVEEGAVEATVQPEFEVDDEDSADEDNILDIEEKERVQWEAGETVPFDPLWPKMKSEPHEEGDDQWRNNVGAVLMCTGFCPLTSPEVYACPNGGLRCADALPMRVIIMGLQCPEQCGWDRVASCRAHYRHMGEHGWSTQLRADLLERWALRAARWGADQPYSCPMWRRRRCNWTGRGRRPLWAHLKSVHGIEKTLKAFPPYPGGHGCGELDVRQRLAVYLGQWQNVPESVDCLVEIGREAARAAGCQAEMGQEAEE